VKQAHKVLEVGSEEEGSLLRSAIAPYPTVYRLCFSLGVE